MKQKRVQKLITFSPQLHQLVELNAKKIGLSFPEYIRILAVNDVKKEVEKELMVSEASEQRIGKSLKDIKKGRFIEVKPGDGVALDKVLEIKS